MIPQVQTQFSLCQRNILVIETPFDSCLTMKMLKSPKMPHPTIVSELLPAGRSQHTLAQDTTLMNLMGLLPRWLISATYSIYIYIYQASTGLWSFRTQPLINPPTPQKKNYQIFLNNLHNMATGVQFCWNFCDIFFRFRNIALNSVRLVNEQSLHIFCRLLQCIAKISLISFTVSKKKQIFQQCTLKCIQNL